MMGDTPPTVVFLPKGLSATAPVISKLRADLLRRPTVIVTSGVDDFAKKLDAAGAPVQTHVGASPFPRRGGWLVGGDLAVASAAAVELGNPTVEIWLADGDLQAQAPDGVSLRLVYPPA